MIPDKIPTLKLRRYDLIHVTAGVCAANNDLPYWCAFGYAAAAVGSSDALEVFEASQCWLQGWVREWKKNNGAASVPEIVTKLIEEKI